MIIDKSNYSLNHFTNSKIIGTTKIESTVGAWQKYQRHLLLEESMKQSTVNGYVCEFGVLKGSTLSIISKHFDPLIVYGFDSFEGLPEAWHLTDNNVFEKGRMALSELPKVEPNVELVKGWYDNTVPVWMETHKKPIRFIHVDCDLYKSTTTILFYLNKQIVPGTVIQFDDFYNWYDPSDYTKWKEGEYAALGDWISKYDRKFEIIGRSNYFQTSIKVL